jgi:hypothetical protein
VELRSYSDTADPTAFAPAANARIVDVQQITPK